MAMDTNTRARAFTLRIPADPIWPLRIEQYHQMIQAGILTDDDPVELLEGWLVTKMGSPIVTVGVPRYRVAQSAEIVHTSFLTRSSLERFAPDVQAALHLYPARHP
jgi:hypothetical protein